jgi:flagellar hook-length control protein FliK
MAREADASRPFTAEASLPRASDAPRAFTAETARPLAADASIALAEPLTAPLAPSKPAASSRAAADILRQRQYALRSAASPANVVPQSAASFETLIALRKADGAFEDHASPMAEHESAVPVSSGTWVAHLPSSASSATMAASAIVPPRPFDQAAWSAALAQQVAASALAAAKETTVRVEPEGLGPIEVRVRVSSEHVDVRFAIEHPVTMAMVRAALPDLERMLAQSGLNLGDAQIAQQNAGQREQATPDRSTAPSSASDDEPVGVAPVVGPRPRARAGLLDDFV